MTRAKQKMLRRNALRNSGGFTLVELLVSLVAGLIVSLAVVSLSKSATQTFYEEQRAASAEMSLRLAIDRVRQDVERASFMASGNVQADLFVPLVAAQSLTKVPTGAPAGLANLAGIKLDPKNTIVGTPTPLSQSVGNTFAADAIWLTGNFTSTDQYAVQSVTTGTLCGGQSFNLAVVSAAWYRVATSPNPATSLAQMFTPVAGKEFMARIADDLGRFQYVLVCGAGLAGPTPFVEIDPTTPVDITQYGFVDGRLTINPVQTVRWEIRQLPAATFPKYAPLDPGAGQPDKYDLVREWVDAGNNVVGDPELIAEYAVDLKFAFTADVGTYTGLLPAPVMVAYNFDDAQNAALAPPTETAATQPQRIRSVRIRLSTRSPFGDRGEPLSAPDGYQMRYCTKAGGCISSADSKDFARMRTLTTEVSLPNQQRSFY
ncbi:MAG: prepilin-type N-terminal cleavage/methylation domain-containing protein [Polyangiaceae bacterium]